MIKQLLKISFAISCGIVLAGCEFDESFSTESAPVYTSTARQVTTVQTSNPSAAGRVTTTTTTDGRSPFRSGNDYNESNVVTTQQQTVTMNQANTEVNSGVIPVGVIRHAPPVTHAAPVVVEQEPVVRSTPSDVIVTN